MKEHADAGHTLCRVGHLTMIPTLRDHVLDLFSIISQNALCHSSACSQSRLDCSSFESWFFCCSPYINDNWNEWWRYHLLQVHLQWATHRPIRNQLWPATNLRFNLRWFQTWIRFIRGFRGLGATVDAHGCDELRIRTRWHKHTL